MMKKEVVLCLGSTVGALGFGYALGFSSPALPAMLGDVFHEVKCSNNEESSSMSALWSSLINLGAMAGALRAGVWLQSLGRRGSLLYVTAPLALVGWLWTYFAIEVGQLLLSRFLIGVSVGVASSAVPVYIAETAPVDLRGALGALNQLAVTLGILLVYLIGYLLPHSRREYNCGNHAQSISPDGWRLLALIGAFIGAFLLLIAFFLPETPIFLMKDYQLLSGEQNDTDRKYTSVTKVVKLFFSAEDDKACAKALRICLSLMLFQQFSGINAVIFYASDILGTAGIKNRDLGGVVVMATQVIMTGLSCFFMDRTGRVSLLTISLTTMTAANALMASYFAFRLPAIFAISALVLYISGFSLGLGPIPWLLMGELLPTRARSLASSLATLLNWSCSFLVTETFATVLLPGLKPAGTFILFALVSAYALFYVKTSLPETKGLSFAAIETTLLQEGSSSSIDVDDANNNNNNNNVAERMNDLEDQQLS